jgi:transcriptional regulator
MYLPRSFRVEEQAAVVAFMRRHDFAAVVTGDLTVSHLPVLVRETEHGLVIAGHVARANPHWRAMDGQSDALVIFQGPHGYISPTWYAAATPAVPTWNYTVVHAHGKPRAREDAGFTAGVLEELTARYEGTAGWSSRSVPPDYYRGLLDAIVGFELPVTRYEAKFKLGQNRSDEDRAAVAAALERAGARDLAELMRAPPK